MMMGKRRNKRRKKDPNGPKRAITAFMFFSSTERENVKKSNPRIQFKDIGRVLGERWNKMTAEEKAPYEAKARADKKRYSEEISGYKNPQSQWLLTPLMNQTVLRTFHCCRKTIGGSDYSQSRRLEFLESIEVCFSYKILW